MNISFNPIRDQKPGAIASLLKRSYAELIRIDPEHWEPVQVGWEQYDWEIFSYPETIGARLFLTCLDQKIVGLASWDPRQAPRYGIIGHNCILPEFRNRGLGKKQVLEILRRFRISGIEIAKVSTHAHPFFAPAQRMYASCGFCEIRRVPWSRNPQQSLIEYEVKIPHEF